MRLCVHAPLVQVRQHYEADQAVLRGLRMGLRDVTMRLLGDRRWRDFAMPGVRVAGALPLQGTCAAGELTPAVRQALYGLKAVIKASRKGTAWPGACTARLALQLQWHPTVLPGRAVWLGMQDHRAVLARCCVHVCAP